MSTTHYKPKYSNTISSHTTHCITYKAYLTWYNWNWMSGRKSSNRSGFGVPSTHLLFIFFLLSHFFNKKTVNENGNFKRPEGPKEVDADSITSTPLKCNRCNKLFKRTKQFKWLLHQHEVLVHQKPSIYHCSLCNKYLPCSSRYKMHMASHKRREMKIQTRNMQQNDIGT